MQDSASGWREELVVSHVRIDREHRELIATAVRLRAAISAGEPGLEIERILSSLFDLTRAHFTSEEGLMLASGYPRYEEHRSEHARLLQQLDMVRSQLSLGYVHASEMLATLVNVITEQHIRFADKHLASFLKDAGFHSPE